MFREIIIIILIQKTGSEIIDVIDYTRDEYILIENGKAVVYDEYGEIFHITNLKYYANIIKSYKGSNKKFKNLFDTKKGFMEEVEIDLEMELIEVLLSQLQKQSNEIKKVKNKNRFERGMDSWNTRLR